MSFSLKTSLCFIKSYRKMCSGSKLSCVSSENAWRFPLSSGLLGFMLGMSTFGAAMKLSEYKESPSLPPLIAAIPVSITTNQQQTCLLNLLCTEIIEGKSDHNSSSAVLNCLLRHIIDVSLKCLASWTD